MKTLLIIECMVTWTQLLMLSNFLIPLKICTSVLTQWPLSTHWELIFSVNLNRSWVGGLWAFYTLDKKLIISSLLYSTRMPPRGNLIKKFLFCIRRKIKMITFSRSCINYEGRKKGLRFRTIFMICNFLFEK